MASKGTEARASAQQVAESTNASMQIIDKFLSRLDGLMDSERLLDPIIKSAGKERLNAKIDDLGKVVERMQAAIEKQDSGIAVVFNEFHNARHDLRELTRIITSLGIVRDSLFIGVFTLCESYLGDVIRQAYLNQAQLLHASEKTITYKELTSFKSVDDAKHYLIEREVDAFLRLSISEQAKYIDDKFKVDMTADAQLWLRYVEACLRRNVVVHAGGKATRQYVSDCKTSKVSWTNAQPVVGEQLTITQEYLIETVNVCYDLGLKTGVLIYLNQMPSEKDSVYSYLNDHQLFLLNSERWEVAKMIGEFVLQLRPAPNDFVRRAAIINTTQALYRLGETAKGQALLDKEDWTAVAEPFHLAIAILRHQYDKACSIMKHVGDKDLYLTMAAYRDWPIFSDFRNLAEFRETFEQVFNVSFLQYAVDTCSEPFAN